MWEIELLPEFAEWWQGLPPDAREAIGHDLDLLVSRALAGGNQGILAVSVTAPQNQNRRHHDQDHHHHQQ